MPLHGCGRRPGRRESIRARFRADPDLAAPHVVDVEVLRVVRRHHAAGRLDDTAAGQAVYDLADWPGERFGHQPLLDRAWELRENVRTWDALYVALAEALQATLITLDRRLAAASGPRCAIEVLTPALRSRREATGEGRYSAASSHDPI